MLVLGLSIAMELRIKLPLIKAHSLHTPSDCTLWVPQWTYKGNFIGTLISLLLLFWIHHCKFIVNVRWGGLASPAVCLKMFGLKSEDSYSQNLRSRVFITLRPWKPGLIDSPISELISRLFHKVRYQISTRRHRYQTFYIFLLPSCFDLFTWAQRGQAA